MRKGLTTGARILGFAVGVAVVSAVFTAGLAIRPAPASAQGTMQGRVPDGRLEPLPLVSESLLIEIDRQHATTLLRQWYLNESASPVEGHYILRLQEGTRLEGFTYYIGNEKVVGQVLERSGAREVYRQVTELQRDPAIVEQEGEGDFRLRIFPIAAGERKRTETVFSAYLGRRGRQVEYRVPIGRGDTEIVVELSDPRELANIVCGTHEIEVTGPIEGAYRIRTSAAHGEPTEFVLRYEVVEEPWTISARVHRDLNRDPFLMLSLAAPAGLASSAVQPRDVTLVLDASGSMAGSPLEQLRASAASFLRELRPNDRVNIIAFDDAVRTLLPRPEPLTESLRARMLAFVRDLRGGGGTNLGQALDRAFTSQGRERRRNRAIVLFTDGNSDPVGAVRVAEQARSDARLFTVGLGNGVNRPLLSQMASLRRGRFVFIPNPAAIEARMGTLFRRIAEPVLVDISLNVTGARLSGTYPRVLPDLFRDDELTLFARLEAGPHPRRISVSVRGRRFDRTVVLRASVDLPARVRTPWVARTWAQHRVADLLEEIALRGERDDIRDEVITHALAYNFVTPYTALLAIPERELTGGSADLFARLQDERTRARRVLPDADTASVNLEVTGDLGEELPEEEDDLRTSFGDGLDEGTLADNRLENGAARPVSPAVGQVGSGSERDFETRTEASGEEPPASSSNSEELALAPGGGCATCAASPESGSPPWLIFFVWVGLRYHRRRRA